MTHCRMDAIILFDQAEMVFGTIDHFLIVSSQDLSHEPTLIGSDILVVSHRKIRRNCHSYDKRF